MLKRILEPEVMDSEEDAVDYDAMNHADVNRVFVADLLKETRNHGTEFTNDSVLLDVGTGTALIPILFCQRTGFGSVVAIDLATEMLRLAARHISDSGLTDRVRIERVDAKSMPYDDGQFDAVMSNSIVHHIPEPSLVFGEMLRVLKPGGLLFVRDLMRPADQRTLDRLVTTYAGEESDHACQLFRDSLHAALTVDEVREILRSYGCPDDWVSQTSDRHWTVSGVKPG